MEEHRKLLVLYSWEEDQKEAKRWALAFCCELQRYTSVDVSCDMLWRPYSNTKQGINQQINDADNILVIVTKSYNKKIEARQGMVSYEELIYENVVKKSTEKNKILFLQKEQDISLPPAWKDYYRVDVSLFNLENFFQSTPKDRQEKTDQIIRFCFNIPEYIIPSIKDRELPQPQLAETFYAWYSEDIVYKDRIDDNNLSDVEQEKRLLEFIEKNASQLSFVDLYIRAGLSADLNLRGRMTPQLFKTHFLVNRDDKEEEKYDAIIDDLFNSPSQNCLCLQSDGGSGKSTFIQTMSLREKRNDRRYFTNIIFDLSNLTENRNTKEDLLFQRVRKEYSCMSKRNGSYYDAWRSTFEKRIKELEGISFSDDRLFAVYDVHTNLQEALPNLLPNKLDDWYKGYTKRIAEAKNAEHTVLFTILIIIYLMILDCKPQLNKPEMFTIVFDNIETYDNGRAAQKISNYVEVCYQYVKNVFF